MGEMKMANLPSISLEVADFIQILKVLIENQQGKQKQHSANNNTLMIQTLQRDMKQFG